MEIPDYTSFTQHYIGLLYFAACVIGFSIILFEYNQKNKLSIWGLFLGAFAIYSFMALADPFLHDWDEQYHALVAKNLMHHFGTPTLIEHPILRPNSIDSSWWTNSHFWLHKQPFFLWQMALSMKIFGQSIFAMRLPSVLMASVIPFFIFRIGTIIHNKKLGFYAAFLTVALHLTLMLVSGRLNTDHNDVAFMFYITASFWAWFEYQKSKKTQWLILIGVFSGIAILVKWLVGLLVFAGWGLSIISDTESRKEIKNYLELLKSMAIAVIVALPWQIYILIKYPVFSRFEYAYNSIHLWKAVEGHDGNWLYHFHKMDYLYTPWFNYFALISLLTFAFLRINKKYKIAILSWIIIVFGFYTLAATKMPTYTGIISALLMLVVVAPWIQITQDIIRNQQIQKIIRMAIAMGLFLWLFSSDEIKYNPAWKKKNWKQNYREAICFERIGKMDLPSKSYFYNFYHFGDIRFMFTTKYQARRFIPKEGEIGILKNAKASIYIFDDGRLPAYILMDSSITKIKSPIWPGNQIEDLEFYR